MENGMKKFRVRRNGYLAANTRRARPLSTLNSNFSQRLCQRNWLIFDVSADFLSDLQGKNRSSPSPICELPFHISG